MAGVDFGALLSALGAVLLVGGVVLGGLAILVVAAAVISAERQDRATADFWDDLDQGEEGPGHGREK